MAKGSLKQCQNCQAVWGIEEISFQECDSCGWPRVEDDEDFEEDWDDREEYEAHQRELYG